MFDNLPVAQPQQPKADPQRPASQAQVDSLMLFNLIESAEVGRKLTSVEASRLLTQREIANNTESAGGLAIRANQIGAKTHPVGMKPNGQPLYHQGETRRSMQLTQLVASSLNAYRKDPENASRILEVLIASVGKLSMQHRNLVELLAEKEEQKSKISATLKTLALPQTSENAVTVE